MYDGQDKRYVLNDPGKQPLGLAFFGHRLFYADSAFDSIEVASVGDDQTPQFKKFKADVEQLVNLQMVVPRKSKRLVDYQLRLFQKKKNSKADL